jgi:hypothetical protein
MNAVISLLLSATCRLASTTPAWVMAHRRLPYLVAINCFDGLQYHDPPEVRHALAIAGDVPVLSCDARNRESTKHVLIFIGDHNDPLRVSSCRLTDAHVEYVDQAQLVDPDQAPVTLFHPIAAHGGRLYLRTATHIAVADLADDHNRQ